MSTNRYLERGVSSKKEDVHNAIKNIDKGLFKNSFCKVIPDILSNDTSYCNIMHADGAGTKSALAYLYWKETNDISVWRGIAHDALIMNIDDLIAVGVTDNFVMSSTIGRNKHLIPGEVISEIIEGNNEMISLLNENDINISSSGGETADVGDITKTILVDSTIVAREKRSKIIECKIKPGNIIVGLSSCGKSSYEDIYNSGIGSNGLTSARHDVLCSYYKENFPETYSKETKDEFIYCGSKRLTDETESELNIGKSLLSPTRTYAPIIKKVLKKNKENISAIIHCTGGGQTKVLHFTESNRIIKDNLFEIPDIFKIIKNESMCSYKEMYSVFNMGHRMEIFTNAENASEIIKISESVGIKAKIIGEVFKSDKKKLTIQSEIGNFEY